MVRKFSKIMYSFLQSHSYNIITQPVSRLHFMPIFKCISTNYSLKWQWFYIHISTTIFSLDRGSLHLLKCRSSLRIQDKTPGVVLALMYKYCFYSVCPFCYAVMQVPCGSLITHRVRMAIACVGRVQIFQ